MGGGSGHAIFVRQLWRSRWRPLSPILIGKALSDRWNRSKYRTVTYLVELEKSHRIPTLFSPMLFRFSPEPHASHIEPVPPLYPVAQEIPETILHSLPPSPPQPRLARASTLPSTCLHPPSHASTRLSLHNRLGTTPSERSRSRHLSQNDLMMPVTAGALAFPYSVLSQNQLTM